MCCYYWTVPKYADFGSKVIYTIYRTITGSYAISWLEYRQTNMFDAKTVVLYWMSNIVVTMFTVQQSLCEIHVDPLMVTSQVQVRWRLQVQHLYKGMSRALVGREPLEWNTDAHWLVPTGSLPTRHVCNIHP